MKQKTTVQGRSMLFNILFVLLNISGLAMVVIGSHERFKDFFLLFNFVGYVLIALSAAGIFIFQGRLMMANVARVLVGSLFIISGLVKANDPIGFAYKLEEYFEDGALAYRIKELFGAPGFSLEFLIPYALTISVLICIAEIVLGVLAILGGKIKLVSYLLMLMMLFFTFLTWHTANCNDKKTFVDRDTYEVNSAKANYYLSEAKNSKTFKIISKTANEVVVEERKSLQCVSDCGCFGDALKGSVGRSLTPTESLWKDIVLLYLVIWIFIAQWIIEPNKRRQNPKFLITSLLLISALSWVFGWYFPILFASIVLIGSLWMLRAGGYFLGNYFGSFLFTAVSSIIMIIYVLMYEPLKDYRPYATGKNIKKEMNDRVVGVNENTFILKNLQSGEKETYSNKEYMDNPEFWDETKYRLIKMTQKVIVPSQPATIEQFGPYIERENLTNAEKDLDFVQKILEKDPEATDIDITNAILKEKQIVIICSRNLNEANWKNIERIKSIWTNCKNENIPFILITNSDERQIYYFRHKNKFNVPVFINDEIGLKAISRSNPSMMILKWGIVAGKYPHRSIPTFDWLKRNVFIK